MFLATELLLQPLNPHFNGMCRMQRLLRVCPGRLTTGSAVILPFLAVRRLSHLLHVLC